MSEIKYEKVFWNNKQNLIKYENRERYKKTKLDEWKILCCINDIYPEIKCYSYARSDGYCKMHEDCNIDIIDDRHEKGDKLEKYIYDILLKCKKLKNIERIGRENGNLDIIYNYKEEEIKRGIQVKMINNQKGSGYHLAHIKKYPEDTVIVSIDPRYEQASIITRKIVGLENEGFYFNSQNPGIHQKYVFNLKDENNKFERRLFKACKKSTIYSEESYYSTTLKEKLMSNNLKSLCKEKNLEIDFNVLSNSVIDCIINKYNCQLKFSNSKTKSLDESKGLCNFSCCKTKASIKGLPYHVDDKIDFFILAYLNEEKYIYYIIPSEYLLKKGYIATDEIKGKASINVAPIDYEKSHWSDQFRNNFILLSETKENMLNKDISNFDIGDRFFYECQRRDIIIEQNTDHNKRILFNLKDKIIRCYETFVNISVKNKNNYQFNLNDKKIPITPDFYIFRINAYPDDLYIIPHTKIQNSGVFNGSRNVIYIPPPGEINCGKPWISDYLNNYEILKNV
uniref:Uncharacterized protein n=1 Tax=viral metagenome TaxID=1070528 RepID=A0A6C0ACY6_9ZZZZ